MACVVVFLSIAGPAPAQTVEAYLDQTSYRPGDTATVFISSPDSVVQYWVEHRGSSDVVYLSGTWTGLSAQAVPDSSFAYGCGWAPVEQFQIGTDWPGGAWTLRLRGNDSATWEHVPFTLNPPVGAPKNPIACVRPVSTLAAYNYYGGASYYYPSHAQRSHVVSFERPWANFGWGAEFSSGEEGVLALLDGYPVDYFDSIDIHMDPSLLEDRKVVVTVYHDEYVSRPMYDAYFDVRDRGDTMLFLAANNIYYQIRYDPATRRQTCYKSAALDPILATQPELATGHWRYDPLNRPEETLVGLSYDGYFGAGAPSTGYTAFVADPTHWTFVGTGVANGQEIGFGTTSNLINGEWDRVKPASPAPLDILLQRDLPEEVLGNSGSATGQYRATYYETTDHYGFPGGSGGRVFASGSNAFGAVIETDPQVRTVLENLLDAGLGPEQILAVDLGTATPASGFSPDQAWAGSGYGHTGGAFGPGDPSPGDAETDCTECFTTVLTSATAYRIDVPAGFYAIELGIWQDAATPAGANLLDVHAEGSPVLNTLDAGALVTEGRGQSVQFLARVEDGILDLDFARPAGDLPLAFLRVTRVWPETLGPSAPASLNLTDVGNGYWVDWPATQDDDVAEWLVEWKPSPTALSEVILRVPLQRSRIFIPDAAVPTPDQGHVWVRARDLSGNEGGPSPEVILPVLPTGTGDSPGAPRRLSISATPNPFNATTLLGALLADPPGELAIFTVSGREVRRWELPDGGDSVRHIRWLGDDEEGRPVASGIYLLRLRDGSGSVRKKITLVK